MVQQITDFRLPGFLASTTDWEKYRLTFEGGEQFRTQYLQQFTSREDAKEFAMRLSMTPIPAFAKTAIIDIRNAIYQPMVDIIRRDGSELYHTSVSGQEGGVDRRGASMNAFIGQSVLEELLVMGKVGVFVDAPAVTGQETLADVNGFKPFLYSYKIEDILSYACTDPENPAEFKALLLQDTVLSYDKVTGLPEAEITRYRHLWLDEEGFVNIQFYDTNSNPVDRDGVTAGPTILNLRAIPFVLLDIGQSLLKDVCEYQIALLNLKSSDVNYALQANFPFYTEQKDLRKVGGHLKGAANPDGTATAGGQGAHVNEIKTGVTQGRAYDKDMDRPQFINPSSEPLKASLMLQGEMKEDIRKLVNLAVQTVASRQSGESKAMDNQGLEAGLSYIGLKLENAERQIVGYWAAYEESVRSNRKIATIHYPDRYSLKSDGQRVEEASALSKVIINTPSATARRELWKTLVTTLLGGKVNPIRLSEIMTEIDDAKFTTSDPEVIMAAKENGLVGEQLASIALGFPDLEYLQARKDHVARMLLIAENQGVIDVAPINAASRGVVDLDDNPQSGEEEKEASRDTTFKDTTKDRTRGPGQNNQE
jgi:hypothetical protein